MNENYSGITNPYTFSTFDHYILCVSYARESY